MIGGARIRYAEPGKKIGRVSGLDQSKRARVKEHRLFENTIGLVCRLPRAQGLTRLIALLFADRLRRSRNETQRYHHRPALSALTPTFPLCYL